LIVAFLVHCNHCKPTPAECHDLVRAWRDARSGKMAGLRAQALARLRTATPAELASLGFSDRSAARDWLNASTMPLGLAFSVVLLDRLRPITPLPPGVWHAMYYEPERLGLPPHLARRTAHGSRLTRWLAHFAGTGTIPPEPTDAHIGRWTRSRTARRLLPLLAPPGERKEHDALRQTLSELDDQGWLMISIAA
jgi:hypothetical protein